MKKIFFSIMLSIISIVTFAQSFTPVSRIAKEGKTLMAYVGSESYPITASEYLNIKEDPTGYFLAEFSDSDADGNFKLIVHKDHFANELLTVDSIGVTDSDEVMVFFKEGKQYTSKSKSWATVLPGQKVQHATINSPRRVFERYHTMTDEQLAAFYNKPATTALPTTVTKTVEKVVKAADGAAAENPLIVMNDVEEETVDYAIVEDGVVAIRSNSESSEEKVTDTPVVGKTNPVKANTDETATPTTVKSFKFIEQ